VPAATALALAAMVTPASAATSPWALRVSLGGAYDSNVAVTQLNTASGQPNALTNIGLSTSYKFIDSPVNSASIAYDFSQSMHESLKQYDIEMHGVTLSGSHKMGKSTADMSYSFYNVLLGNRAFLQMHVVDPGVLTQLSSRVFIRTDVLYLNESFLTDHTRNAAHYQPGVLGFYFFDNYRAFLLLGANYQTERTVGAPYDYNGYDLKASLTLPLDIGQRKGKVKTSYEWTSLRYLNVTQSIGAKRYDQSSRFDVNVEMPIEGKFSAALNYEYVVRLSNLSTMHYAETVAGGNLVYNF
jgi:hypothetical protein